MNRWITFAIAGPFLLLASFVYSQEPRDDARPQEPPRQAEPRPEPRQDAPAARQDEMKPPQQETRDDKASKDEKRQEKQEQKEEKNEKKEQSTEPSREESRPAHQQQGNAQAAPSDQHRRPAGRSAHIPDDKFRATYGRQHAFVMNRVINQTTVIVNQTQFVYGGYTFVFLDPWPSDWLFTDDCYIDYVDDDYFLFDVLHPGIRVALFVIG